ncbi:MAG: hypothetical protein IKC22_04020 [Bacilli bacterium]|nr:hypothetical protein [Bacilli bacterium]
MNLKTREELSNEYWMKFLKSGRIEDYLAFKRINHTKIDQVEFASFGENNDNNTKTKNTRTDH